MQSVFYSYLVDTVGLPAELIKCIEDQCYCTVTSSTSHTKNWRILIPYKFDYKGNPTAHKWVLHRIFGPAEIHSQQLRPQARGHGTLPPTQTAEVCYTVSHSYCQEGKEYKFYHFSTSSKSFYSPRCSDVKVKMCQVQSDEIQSLLDPSCSDWLKQARTY